ncbi:MAG: helix-turn-helix domain-containing protein [Gemmobacter sp.]
MSDATNLHGEALVVLTRAEYDALIEDAGDAALIAEARQDDGPSMSAALVLQVLDGLHPLTAWRKALGLTQGELAEKAGVRVATVSDIESGKIDPRLSTLVSLAAALGVGVGDLVK